MSGFPPESGAGDTSTGVDEARQLALDLERQPGFAAEDYVVGPANAEAFALLSTWPDWPHAVVLLHGAAASGKSHLAQIWAGRAGAAQFGASGVSGILPALIAEDRDSQASLVEDIDRKGLDEDGLFHLINHTLETGGTLLLTAQVAKAHLQISLPDLASRLRAASAVEILQPDIDMLDSLLVKLFADRQVDVDPKATAFATGRMERSYAAAAALVQTVDRMALEQGRRITIPLLRRYFEDSDSTR